MDNKLKNYRKLSYILAFILLLIASCKTTRNIENELMNIKENGNEIIAKSEGDLNLDGINDLVIVVENKKENIRIVNVFIKDKNDGIIKKFSNQNIILSKEVSAYDFDSVTINNGKLFLNYYGGMCRRESQTLIFEYQTKTKELSFYAFKVFTHNVCNETKDEQSEETELRGMKFAAYIKEY